MLSIRFLTTGVACLLLVTTPAAAPAAQDLRGPDARDATPTHVQDLRGPDARDAAQPRRQDLRGPDARGAVPTSSLAGTTSPLRAAPTPGAPASGSLDGSWLSIAVALGFVGALVVMFVRHRRVAL